MSKETIIKYKEKGFWINQAFLEILSQFVCEAFENIGLSTFSSNLKDIYEDCNSNRKGEKIGMVNILFDDSIVSSIDKASINRVLEQSKTLILLNGDEIDIHKLNLIESQKNDDYFKNTWSIPIKTQSLISTVSIIQQMINGTWEPEMSSIYFEGFNNPDGVSEI